MRSICIKSLLLTFLLACSAAANAQLVSCNVFLQGNYIEVGINASGAFGSSAAAPAGYHPKTGSAVSLFNPCSACGGGMGSIGFVADPDKDGWTVGTPNYYGDFFLPGAPQEGWGIKSNGHSSTAYNINGFCGASTLYTGGMTGSNLSYSSVGQTRSGTWQGINSDSVQITQVTSLDTGNLYFTVHLTLKNTGVLTKSNVYYIRTVDPDNDETQTAPVGSFSTNNTITYQLPNALNATLVSATGTVYTNAYLGLGTLDCRAKCFISSAGAFIPPVGADSMYNQLTPAGVYYTGVQNNADDIIGLVFQLGNIAPGDSVNFAYAYILKQTDLVAALNTTAATWAATTDTALSAHISKDTAHVCAGSSVTVNISDPNGLSWNWLSLTGESLSTTTGTSVTVTTGTTLIRLWAIANAVCTGITDTLYIDIQPAFPIPVTPSAGSNSPLCAGNTLNLTSSTTTSGVNYSWSGPSGFASTLQNPSVAGITTAATGTYSVVATIATCSSGVATTTVTVNSITTPVTPSTAAVCTGFTTNLTAAPSGGAWSTTTGNASVSSTGGVTGVTAGLDIVKYTLGACVSQATVNVVASAPIAPLTSSVCAGNSVILTDAATGVWSASNGFATVGSGGDVTGVAAGTDTIFYTIFSGATAVCTNTATVNVLNGPGNILPSTPVSICLGATASLSNGTPGGTWTSGSPGVATVGTSGLVTGVSIGTAVISYSIGTCIATKTVTVVNAPSAITPASSAICQGATLPLSESVLGGAWTSTNGSVASVGSTGIVTGNAPGSVTITYAIGACSATAVVTVNLAPAAINPATPVVMCLGSSVNLTDATSGGAWSSTGTSIATVIGGTVTGAGIGTATISYTLGSCAAVKDVTVVAAPGPVSPSSSVICAGSSETLSDGVGFGTWTSGNTGIATIGSSSGFVTGVAAGAVTITYSIGTCTTTATVTVNPLPAAILPSGPVSICVGNTTTLSDAGGTWSSGNTSLATVGSSTGIVTGTGSGSVNISFTNGFGCSVVKVVTVAITPGPVTPPVAGVCIGGTTTLTDGVGAGTWTSGNIGIATIGSASGIATGVSAGSAAITYSIGSCFVISTVTVSPAAGAGSISGASGICAGSSTTLTDPAPGGTWTSNSLGVATVGASSGIVTGVGAGIATISYTVANLCGSVSATHTVNVVPSGVSVITGPSSVCAGTFAILGEGTTGGTWSVSNSHASITGTGLLTGISIGVDTVTYTVTDVCGTFSATKVVSIGAFLSAGTISGAASVCAGSSISLTDPATGGAWTASNGSASVSGTGSVTGSAAGVDTIMYTVTSSCGSAAATHVVTVNALPNAGAIVGAAMTCAGILTSYSNAVSGGAWSLSNMIIASISSLGVLTPVTPGIDTIKYTVSNSCGTAIARKPVTIGPFLTAGTISGPSFECQASAVTLTDPVPGGTWSASNSSASVLAGIVSGIAGGIDTIMYSVSSSCGTAVASHVVTVNPLPDAGAIVGPSSICTGSATTYTNSAAGGTWSMTNGLATISGGGVVTVAGTGIDTIVYTVTNICGAATTTLPVTIGATLTASPVTGPGNVCVGASITLANALSGGSWTSTNTAAATIGSSTGIVTGVNVGTTTISYTVSNSCGTVTASTVVTVSPVATVAAISGPSSLCVGSFSLFTDPVPGGTWSSSNATATISGSGVINAVSPGTDTVTYTVNTGCSTAAAAKVITIAPGGGAGTITGLSSVCTGAAITLSDAAPGGSWSVSNSTAVVSSTGVVTGLAAGVDTVMYSVAGSCGLAVAIHTVSVITSGIVSPISGPSGVCVGSLILLTDATPSGAWSSSNTHATVTTAGVVTGITPGVDTISYTIVGVCGLSSSVKVITIGSLAAAGPISGPSSVCEGASVTLTNTVSGGLWTTITGHASVGSLSGIVTGISAGVDTVVYTLGGVCGSSSVKAAITVNPAPDAGTIGGPDSVCIGTSITLTDIAPGGIWSAGNANAIVSGGLVTGISAGTDPVSYSVVNSCGTASALKIVVVTATPSAGLITGPGSVCVGSGITLTDPVPGGSWVVSNANAIVAGPGIIDGVAVGADTVFYVVTNLCGTSTTAKIIAVNPVPVVAPISGATTQCVGTTLSLTDVTSGGVWNSSDPSVAAVGLSGGAVIGVAAGTATITYTVTNILGCPTSVTISDTVVVAPVTPAITGSSNVCVGTTVTLADAAPGGAWTSSNPAIASVSAGTGIVSGIAVGSANITYTITNGCGTAFATQTENVNAMPAVAAITGLTSVCQGANVALADGTSGGFWSSSNPAVAAVGSVSGTVTGITPGIVSINYSVNSPAGCTVTVSIPDTVVAAPSVASITGVTTQCVGAASTLSNSTPAGTWNSANPSIATVGAVSGTVSGIAAGTTIISYSVSNTAGCTTTVVIGDTVSTLPVVAPVTGPLSVCISATITLTDATPGGTWSAANTHATVSGGIVTGISSGTDIISYTLTNSCGSTSATTLITVGSPAAAGTITGSSNVCVGTSVTLADTASGGAWSTSNGNANVGTAGVVTGIAVGIDTIFYSVTTPCGASTASHIITIGILPTVNAITGAASVCKGASIALADATAGGAWSAGNARATVGSTGIVTGVTAGVDTIFYTVSNACGSVSATKSVSIIQTPSPGIISGPSDVCPGASISLSDIGGSPGGTWSSNNTGIATVASGVVTGVATGSATINYTVSNTCGSRSATHGINVLPATECNTRVNTAGRIADELSVYPNPNKGIFTLELTSVNDEKVTVIITNIIGKKVKELTTATNQATNVHLNVASGIYLVTATTETGIKYVTKLTVQ